jgi:hypothetical protein
MTIIEPSFWFPLRLVRTVQYLPERLYFKDRAVQLSASGGHSQGVQIRVPRMKLNRLTYQGCVGRLRLRRDRTPAGGRTASPSSDSHGMPCFSR